MITAPNHVNEEERLKTLMKSPTTWRVLTLALLFGVTNAGYCADSGNADLDGQLTKVQDIIFGKQIRTIVLLFGMAWGFFNPQIQAAM